MSPAKMEVYRFPEYPFAERPSKPKYAIVLGQAVRLDNDRDDHVLIALTTSQSKHYKAQTFGCHANEPHPHFFIPERTVPFFPIDTHVDVEGVERAGHAECQYDATFVGTLDETLFQDVFDCVLATDIPALYRQALTTI